MGGEANGKEYFQVPKEEEELRDTFPVVSTTTHTIPSTRIVEERRSGLPQSVWCWIGVCFGSGPSSPNLCNWPSQAWCSGQHQGQALARGCWPQWPGLFLAPNPWGIAASILRGHTGSAHGSRDSGHTTRSPTTRPHHNKSPSRTSLGSLVLPFRPKHQQPAIDWNDRTGHCNYTADRVSSSRAARV